MVGFEVQARYIWVSTGVSYTSYKVQMDRIDGGNALYMHTGCLMNKGITMVDRGLQRQAWTTLALRSVD